MIPRVVHFVYGLRQQREPMPFVHYACLESCRRVIAPERIVLHHGELPWGPWWERIRAHLELVPVAPVEEVLAAGYEDGRVPEHFRYAHHADFIRLDALIEHGGIYADIDTIFLRPPPPELFEQRFVIGREPPVLDERSGEPRPSLCNAIMLAQPGAAFARAWRARMAQELDGSWSNHSGFLAQQLSREMPDQVRIEPEHSFFPFPATIAGLDALLRERHEVPAAALSVHLWEHLWWERRRRDFTPAHAGWTTAAFLAAARTTLAELLRPYLPHDATCAAREARVPHDATPPARGARAATASAPARARPAAEQQRRWSYLSTDDVSGYGIAADRCMAALRHAGVTVDWLPYVPTAGRRLFYAPGLSAAAAPAPATRAPDGGGTVVVAHLVPEYLPYLRRERPEAFLVGHTVWETDRLPPHWPACIDRADLIVVPCRFNARVIEASEVRTPVAVVPHVAPHPLEERPHPLWAWIPEETLVFYTIAMWTERKAVFRTVEAFLRAFSSRDRVLLIVKSSFRDYTRELADGAGHAREGTTARTLARLLARSSDPPAVRLVARDLSEEELDGLHLRGDCFVSLSHSEGWGLGGFDAAAYGKPVITTGFGGQLEYLDGSPLLVDYALVPVRDAAGAGSYNPDQHWAEPDVEHGAQLLRELAADPAPARAQAAERALQINARYAPDAVGPAFLSAVESALTRARSPAGRAATG